jgi:Kinesin motor domain
MVQKTGAKKAERLKNPELSGVTPRCFQQIFDAIATFPDKDSSFLVEASYMEIYNEEIRDLLAKDHKRPLQLHQDDKGAFYVKDITRKVVKDLSEIYKLMELGDSKRSTGKTKMNNESSRSHSIFTCTVGRTDLDAAGKEHIRQGKLNLVDLAGSERQAKTEAEGQRLKEAVNINLSLSALGNVISALVDAKSKHIPYRDSKLTKILQDSLGGNSKTVMIATISPALDNAEETLTTLRYANRAKQIKNKPVINEDPKDARIREFKDEIARMRAMLGDGFDPNAPVEKKVVVRKEYVDFEVEGVDPEILEQMKTKKESEVMAALSKQGMSEAERQRIQQQLDQARRRREQEARKEEQLRAKMMTLTQQLGGAGGIQLMDENAIQKAQLRAQEAEMKQQQLDREMAQRRLAEAEAEAKLTLQTFATVEEDIAAKNAQLEDLWNRFKAVQAEADDARQACQQEREDLLQTVRGLSKELKWQILITTNFIPAGYLKAIQRHAHRDPGTGEWLIDYVDLAGNSTRFDEPDEDVGDSGSAKSETTSKSSISTSYLEKMEAAMLSYKAEREAFAATYEAVT